MDLLWGEEDLSPHHPAHWDRVTQRPRMPQVAQRARIIRCLMVWALGAKLDTMGSFLPTLLTALLMGQYMDKLSGLL